MSETVYDRIRQCLRRYGIKESRAALDAGLSNAAIRNIRRRGGIPNGRTLEKLAAYFDVSPEWLLTGRKPYPDEAPEFTPEPHSIEVPAKSRIFINDIELEGPAYVVIGRGGLKIIPGLGIKEELV